MAHIVGQNDHEKYEKCYNLAHYKDLYRNCTQIWKCSDVLKYIMRKIDLSFTPNPTPFLSLSCRFDGYKVHFRLQPQPLTTRVGFGEECTEGAPLMEYYAGCREPTCFTTQQVPTVYLIDADVGEGFRFTNYSEIAVFDPGFECKMMQLNFAHVSSIVRGPDLLSSTNQIADLQPCCTLPGCPCASDGVRASVGKPAYIIVCSVAILLWLILSS